MTTGRHPGVTGGEMSTVSSTTKRGEAALRKIANAYPESHEDFPWGHVAVKVRTKAFLFLAASEKGLSISVKLPRSGDVALTLPFATPTEYGLGKHGWVTARFGPKEKAPVPLLGEWIDESYRAIAPKKLVAQLDESKESGSNDRAPKKRAAPRKKSAKSTTAAR